MCQRLNRGGGGGRIPRKAFEPVTKARRSNRIAVQRIIANRIADDAANIEHTGLEHHPSALINKLPDEILLNIMGSLEPRDIQHLVRTCRRLGLSFKNEVLRLDIKTNTYDSLLWACRFGDADLAKRCLLAGASPDAAFCPVRRPEKSDLYGRRLSLPHHLGYECPVVPTKLFEAPWLGQYAQAYCALTMAVELNHIAVMKVLLGFWDNGSNAPAKKASIVERRSKSPHPLNQDEFSRSRWLPHHSVALSHVHSLEAAQLLVAAGEAAGDTHINDTGNLFYTPLEVLLYRRKYVQNSKPQKKSEKELFSIVKLLLDNGAHPRQSNWTLTGGNAPTAPRPLLAAIETRCQSVIQLILQSGPLDVQNAAGEYVHGFGLALQGFNSDIFEVQSSTLGLHRQGARQGLLDTFLKAGASPNDPVGGGKRPLFLAIGSRRYGCVRSLLQWNADPNFTDSTTPCPLVQSMPGYHSYTGSHESLVALLLEFGANVNQPSLTPQGFTPLMFATSPSVSPSTFEVLLQQGAERGSTGQLSLGCPKLSVLQCLMTGFLEPRCDGDTQAFRHIPLRMTRGSYRNQDNPYELHPDLVSKFKSFIAPSLESSHFQTEGGRHILNWAIDNLYGEALSWAIKLLAPYYKSTKLATDEETPLSTFFSPARARGYLMFGSLPAAYEALHIMLECNLDAYEGDRLGTILHQICKLPTVLLGESDPEMWSQVLNTCDVDAAYKRLFLRNVKVDCDEEDLKEFRRDGTGAVFLFGMRIRKHELEKFKRGYKPCRAGTIAQMIALFLERGVDFYTQGPDGQSAYEHSKRNGTWRYVPKKWRE
ncbi:ankyrin repeat-containing domain protein [Ilyonectria destructans]|nr:ankyrin repeat-containing domain protein [Ilyonectria destructans]